MESDTNLNCCSSRLPKRDLLNQEKAGQLEDLFKILGNDTRLRILHALARCSELCVCDLASLVDMAPQAVSNQLARLSDRGIVSTRRAGNNIYYRVVDSCVMNLLDQAMCLMEDSDRTADSAAIDQTHVAPFN